MFLSLLKANWCKKSIGVLSISEKGCQTQNQISGLGQSIQLKESIS